MHVNTNLDIGILLNGDGKQLAHVQYGEDGQEGRREGVCGYRFQVERN